MCSQFSTGYVTSWLIAGDGGSVPWPDTTAELITLFQSPLNATGFVVGSGAVLVLGYWAGGQLELRHHYRRFLLAVGLGGLIGYVAPILLFFVGTEPLYGEQLGVTAVLFTDRAVGVDVQFAVVGLAGGAFAGLTTGTRRSDAPPSRSLE